MALAIVLGLMGGVGLALVLEFFDSSVHRTEDLEALTGRPVLGLVPMVKSKQMRADNPNVQLPDRAVGHYSAKHPKSSVSEAFRSLRTSLMFSTPEGMPKTILVTSPGPGRRQDHDGDQSGHGDGPERFARTADRRRPSQAALHRDFGKHRARA